MPWFRMYVDFLNDPKLIALAFEDQRHFIGLLALKSDGALDSGCEPELLDRIVAQRLWIDQAVIREVKKRLMAAGLISDCWQPLAWEKRQFRSDSSKERVAKFRAKKKAGAGEQNGNGEGNATGNEGGNGGETLQKRPSNAVDTEADTDTETKVDKTEKEQESVGSARPAAAPASAPPSAAPTDKAKGTRLSKDWVLPKRWGEWALQERQDLTAEDVRREAACFADHWHGKAGADARKADWEATWRNWIRRVDRRKAAGAAQAGAPNKQEALEQRNRSVGAAWASQGGGHAAA